MSGLNVYHDAQYLNLLRDVLENGVHKGDRTGTGTTSVFSRQMRFDLSDGTIPLLTTKRMHIPSIIHELLWYVSGSSNIKYLKDNGVRIWNEWATSEGHLNRVYGSQWRQVECFDWYNHVSEIQIRSPGIDTPFVPPTNDTIEPNHNISDELIGKKFTNNNGHEFIVVDKQTLPGEENSTYTIQFTNTTSIVKCLRPDLRRGQVLDPYEKTTFNEGCVGVYSEHHEYRTAAYNMWYNMMKRCYDSTIPEYSLYGGSGVFVDSEWRCFSNFLRDIHNIPHFSLWKVNPNSFQLDKDYFGSNCYSGNTCIFLPNEYNQILPKLDGTKIIATHKETGNKYEFTVQRWFAKQHGIKHSQSISTALKHSPTSSTKEWTFEKVNPKTGFVYRQSFVIDQLQTVINTLRTNPDCRRMIVNSWNVAQIPDMKLPPCHFCFQVYATPIALYEREKIAMSSYQHDTARKDVDVGNLIEYYGTPTHRLSLLIHQRSCDLFLGVPFNISQYGILLCLIANVAGMLPGELIWEGGDIHIYDNHHPQVDLQLHRIPYPSPTLTINTRKSIDDFTFDDFTINNYISHEPIKATVAV